MDLGHFSPFSPAGSDWMRMMPQGRTGTVEDAAAEGDTSELSSDTKSATALEEKREDGDEDSAAKEKKRPPRTGAPLPGDGRYAPLL